MSAARPVQVTRWAEGVYALVAFYFAVGLPAPSPTTAVAWVHWLGTALLAALLCWRLRRPNPAMLTVAAILSAYVLANAVWALPRLAAVVRGGTGLVASIAVTLGVLIWLSQLTVLASVVWARQSGAVAPTATRRHVPPA